MANSKYVFKKLKAKPLSAKIVDSTAVRVLANAAKKITSHWKKFVAYTGSVITNVRAEAPKMDDVTRITNKMEENQNLVDTIKADEKANSADFKVLAKAQAENEKLAAKLEKLLNKKVTVETKEGVSPDLSEALANELDANNSTLDELNKAFDEAGIAPVTPEVQVAETPVVEAPVPEVKPEPVVAPVVPTPEVEKEPEVAPVAPVETPQPVVNEPEMAGVDPVVSDAIDAIKNAKNLADQNQQLSTENQTLKETNSKQAVSIANLTKEVETLKTTVKNQTTLEQKLGEYEGVISRHEKERSEMAQEVEKLRLSSKENEVRIKQLEVDMSKIVKERDYYKSQILVLKNAMGFSDPVATPAQVEESKVR